MAIYIKKTGSKKSLLQRLKRLDWTLMAVVFCVCCLGILTLYSAGYHCVDDVCRYGSFSPWALKQAIHLIIGFVSVFIIALLPPPLLNKLSYVAYVGCLILLVGVLFLGEVGLGAQRWINLAGVRFQPSELVKIGLVLALAKQLSTKGIYIKSNMFLLVPAILIAIPFLMVLKQPDLGTALILLVIGIGMLFVAGVPMKKFMILGCLALISLPVIWLGLHDYQKKRVMTFINPDKNLATESYHINQAKIAMGSGGFFGQGFLKGSQSQLNFLPEKHTDFIFTMFAEEFGFFGGLILLLLYSYIVFKSIVIGMLARSVFLKFIAIGLGINIFCYMFINVAMIMGVLPVVGVPLPLVSFGGTASIVVLWAIGLIQNVNVNRELLLGKD